ncbi:MAG: MarR family winged helix-turn-helix transcriptional regulator [Rectinemataceae bacterium]
MSTKKRSLIPDRESLIETLFRAGRENSMATVMFHTVVAEFMGLAPSDSKTLDLLDRSGPMSPSEIAAQTGLTAGSVTSLVDRLEKKGFVRRVRTSKDRRSIVVELAAERLAAAVPLFDPFRRSAEALVKDYSDSDLEVIADFLKRNSERVRRETAAFRESCDRRE